MTSTSHVLLSPSNGKPSKLESISVDKAIETIQYPVNAPHLKKLCFSNNTDSSVLSFCCDYANIKTVRVFSLFTFSSECSYLFGKSTKLFGTDILSRKLSIGEERLKQWLENHVEKFDCQLSLQEESIAFLNKNSYLASVSLLKMTALTELTVSLIDGEFILDFNGNTFPCLQLLTIHGNLKCDSLSNSSKSPSKSPSESPSVTFNQLTKLVTLKLQFVRVVVSQIVGLSRLERVEMSNCTLMTEKSLPKINSSSKLTSFSWFRSNNSLLPGSFDGLLQMGILMIPTVAFNMPADDVFQFFEFLSKRTTDLLTSKITQLTFYVDKVFDFPIFPCLSHLTLKLFVPKSQKDSIQTRFPMENPPKDGPENPKDGLARM